MIYIKMHDTEKGDIIAMCDHDLIDKILSEGDTEINVKDYSDFYKGELVDMEKAASMLDPERVYSTNIVGKESVEAAIKGAIIHKDGVKEVNGVPYANSFKIKY